MLRTRPVQLCLFGVLALYMVEAEGISGQKNREQAGFGSEADVPGEVFIEKPVEISDGALQTLKGAPRIESCLESGTMRGEVQGAWFLGSEIHLSTPHEADLVVLPNTPRLVARQFPVKVFTCMLGAHGGWFWVLRGKTGKYQLLLETFADALEVLNSKTNEYRDIQTDSATGVSHTTLIFKFDGHRYKLFQRKDTN